MKYLYSIVLFISHLSAMDAPYPAYTSLSHEGSQEKEAAIVLTLLCSLPTQSEKPDQTVSKKRNDKQSEKAHCRYCGKIILKRNMQRHEKKSCPGFLATDHHVIVESTELKM